MLASTRRGLDVVIPYPARERESNALSFSVVVVAINYLWSFDVAIGPIICHLAICPSFLPSNECPASGTENQKT
jgi:hypothetical protein